MQGSDAHVGHVSQIVDAYGLGIMAANPLYRSTDLRHSAVGKSELCWPWLRFVSPLPAAVARGATFAASRS